MPPFFIAPPLSKKRVCLHYRMISCVLTLQVPEKIAQVLSLL